MQKYYTTTQVAQIVGVTRQTILRWLKEGRVPEVERTDRNWRIFTEKDIEVLKAQKGKRKPLVLRPRRDYQSKLFNDKEKSRNIIPVSISDNGWPERYLPSTTGAQTRNCIERWR